MSTVLGQGGDSLTVSRELAPWNPTQSLACQEVAGEPLRKRALEPFTRARGTRGKMALKSSAWGLSASQGPREAVGAQPGVSLRSQSKLVPLDLSQAEGPSPWGPKWTLWTDGCLQRTLWTDRCLQGNRGVCYSQPDKADPTGDLAQTPYLTDGRPNPREAESRAPEQHILKG